MPFLQTLFSPDAWQLLGRFHVIIVHFPIALLITAAFVEACSLLRRKTAPPRPAPAAFACLLIGALAAVAAATTGWLHADYETFPAGTLFYHRWLGIASAALALFLLILFYLARSGKLAALRRYQLATFLVAILVGITGHLGGILTHGPDYLTINPSPATTKPSDQITGPTTTPTTTLASTPTTTPATTSAPASVTYTQVEPILSHSCYFCHGPMRQRGGLRLDSLEALLRGGEHGPVIVLGNSEKSPLIRRCLGLDNVPRMPFRRPPLPEEQIQLLRQWIDSFPTTIKPPTP